MGSGHALVVKTKEELVRTMLRNGGSPELVSSLTGIALEEIRRIGAEG